jgi:hypothetical protein
MYRHHVFFVFFCWFVYIKKFLSLLSDYLNFKETVKLFCTVEVNLAWPKFLKHGQL